MSDVSNSPTGGGQETSGVQERAQEVAGEVGHKAQEAAGTAQDKLREQLDRRSTEAGETVSGTAEDLRSVGEELRKQGKDTPARLADKAAGQADRLGAYLKEADGNRMLADAEDFGRRQPLAILAGGVVAGIAAARFLKASSRGRYRSLTSSESPTTELGATMPAQPRGVYPEGEAEGAGLESGRQAPVPAGSVTGR